MLSLDCETTGMDHFHGTRAFIVTTCSDDGTQRHWEWGVNPITRQPVIPPGDLREIRTLLGIVASWGKSKDEEVRERHVLVGQNFGFDAHVLAQLGLEIPWSMVRDTLVASHLLASNLPHNLTALVLQYLGVDILPYEEAVKAATQECRRMVQQARLKVRRAANKRSGKLPLGLLDELDIAAGTSLLEEEQGNPIAAWRIAEEGHPDSPSVQGDKWHSDMWLPRSMIKHLWENSKAGREWQETMCTDPSWEGWEYRPPEASEDGKGHSWWTVTLDYANADSAVTVALWPVMRKLLEDRKLWRIYLERLRMLPVIYGMERHGVTVNRDALTATGDRFREEAEGYGRRCVEEATQYDDPAGGKYCLTLPKSGNNGSLTRFVFDVMRLPPTKASKKTGKPSLDKETVDGYLESLDVGSRELSFVEALRDKRKRDKAVADMETYGRYLLPLGHLPGWCVLHPRVNLTGTHTLRMSSDNPNSQSISKQEDFTLRTFFGPVPGREWYSMDYENIELRIPAYESGERVMIDLFEKPDDPPYFGSYHLMNASIIYPDLFYEKVCPDCLGAGCPEDFGAGARNKRMCGSRRVVLGDVKGGFKSRYESTWYRWTKFFGFAFAYGGQERTCDRSARKQGAWALVKDNLKEHSCLNAQWVRYAERMGYVETIPDASVDPDRGYPVMCSRGDFGRISPTVPLNYHVQSTAGWCMQTAMVRCQDQLDRWNSQVLAAAPTPLRDFVERERYLARHGFLMVLTIHDELVFDMPAGLPGNWAKVARLRYLMEESGRGISVPLKVSVSFYPRSWGEAVKV